MAQLESTKPDREKQQALASMITQLLEHWQLSDAQQLSVLGLGSDQEATLRRYRRGEPMGLSRDLQDRVGYLLGIHKSLRLLFPHQKERNR